MAERSEVWVCGGLIVGIGGLNPVWGIVLNPQVGNRIRGTVLVGKPEGRTVVSPLTVWAVVPRDIRSCRAFNNMCLSTTS